MAAAGFDILSTTRLKMVIDQLQDVRDIPRDLVWLNRTPMVPAEDDDIIGRWIGRVMMADLVPDDAAALVYSSGKMNYEFYQVPNIKVGRTLTQSQIRQVQNLAMKTVAGEQGFLEFAGPFLRGLILGVRQRMEYLCVAMMIDDMEYDRFGFKAEGLTWGMPADLKVTVATPWDNPAATPVTDIQTVLLVAQQRYGMSFPRMTMSLQAFRYMIATTEFQDKAKVVIPQTLLYSNFSLLNIDEQRKFASSALGVAEIEFNDSRGWSLDAAGNETSSRFWPLNKVVLDNPSNDNNQGVRDFANGVVTESIFTGLRPASVIGTIPAGTRGPVSYCTFPPDLNPPNLTSWGVARGFPRKFVKQSNAVLTVGTFADQIPVTEPF